MAVQGVSPRMLARLWVAVVLLCLSGAQPASSEMSSNYYDTLSVEPTATDRQIKKAFHRLAMKYHPDKNKSTEAEKTFRKIAEAYEVLSNKEKRRQYDQLGHKAFLQNENHFNPETQHEASVFDFSFDDLFMNFNLDDFNFMEQPHFQWSFPLEGEGEDEHYEHHGFHGFHAFSDLPDAFFYGQEGEEEEHEFY